MDSTVMHSHTSISVVDINRSQEVVSEEIVPQQTELVRDTMFITQASTRADICRISPVVVKVQIILAIIMRPNTFKVVV